MLVASLITGTYALAVVVLRGRQLWLMGVTWTRSLQVMVVLGPLSVVLFFVSAFVHASVAVYALALCIQLGVAAVSFYSLIATTT